MKVQTILFDLDGTLLNTLDDLADSVNYALRAYRLPERTVEQTRLSVGSGVRNLMLRSVPGGEAHPAFESILDCFRAHYAEHSLDKTAPYDGILPLLDELTAAGVKIGVVSNKFDAAVKQICKHYFGSRIAVAIGEAEEKGVRKKPAPDAVFKALRELDAPLEGAVYIGDSEVDVETAKNAGLPCISVTWGFRSEERLRQAGATVFAHTAKELSALLALPQTE